METRWGGSNWYKSFKHIPILPTRHGNKYFLVLRVVVDPRFRSYLRGMETSYSHLLQASKTQHSDPTYEAWKLDMIKKAKENIENSDPTYEAWKPPWIKG